MSEAVGKNGKKRRILLVEDEGKAIVQINTGGPEIEVDVIGIQNAWLPIDQGFRDDKGVMPQENVPHWNEALRTFVIDLFVQSAGDDIDKQTDMLEEGKKLSLAGALTFLKVITEEADRLRVFFEPKSPGGPSSRGNTELTFST